MRHEEKKMRARFAITMVMTLGLALAACGSGGSSSPSTSTSGSLPAREAGISLTQPLIVENQLNDWWGGNGIPITWKVSEVDTFDWDGVSRPDAAPPHGFQGLVQQTGSGPYRVPLELASPTNVGKGSRFVLTPTVTIDSQGIDLPPIVFKSKATNLLAIAGVACQDPFDDTGALKPGASSSAVASLSQRTPRGLLMYDVVMTCQTGRVPWTILVRNYQKP